MALISFSSFESRRHLEKKALKSDISNMVVGGTKRKKKPTQREGNRGIRTLLNSWLPSACIA
jgi:hypothetical protein